MDAHALLTSQGWRGTGHSLHATSDNTGLRRPILVSQKKNVLGIGQKQHKTSDMWWMNAFDKSLKGLDTSQEGTVVQTLTSGSLDMVARGGGKYAGKEGLYACFVKGETLGGSLTPEDIATSSQLRAVSDRQKHKESKEERRARKAARRAQKTAKSAVDTRHTGTGKINLTTSHDDGTETKEERRERRRQKRLLNSP